MAIDLRPSARKNAAEVSPSLVSWMIRHRIGLVCSACRTGRLLFIGSRSNGAPVFTAAQFAGAMGIAAFSQRVYLATQAGILRLEKALWPDELVDDRFDRLFVPRNAQITGNVGQHELSVEPSDQSYLPTPAIPASLP